MDNTQLGNPNFSGVTQDASYGAGTATVQSPSQTVTARPIQSAPQFPQFNPNKPVDSNVLASPFTLNDVLTRRNELQRQFTEAQKASERELALQQRIKDVETGSTTGQLALEGQGRGITQDILSKQGAAIARREAIAKLPLVNELNALVSQRTNQIDALKSELQFTTENLNILRELQKETQPEIIGSPTINKQTGDITVLTRNPQTGAITSGVVGNVGPTEAGKEFVQTGYYTNDKNERVFYGVTPDGRIEQTVLGTEQLPASVIARQTAAPTATAAVSSISNVDDAVGAILNGTATISDFSIAGNFRGKVASSLAKKRQELIKSGDTVGLLRSSAGGKDISDTTLQSLNKGLGVLEQIGGLAADIQNIDTGPIVGAFKGRNPWDTNASVIKARLNSIIPNLARGIYGEVGVLTDNDIKIYRETLPNLSTPQAAIPALLYITVDRIRKSYEGSLKTQAAGGRDVSGFAGIYEEMNTLANDLLAQVGSPTGNKNAKPPLSAFQQATSQSGTRPSLSSFFK